MSDGLDLDAIETRAQAATPGPWREDGPWWYDAEDGSVRASSLVTADQSRTAVAIPPTAIGDGTKFDADMAHIAGMDPATALALVSRLREAETQLANVREDRDHWRELADRLAGRVAAAAAWSRAVQRGGGVVVSGLDDALGRLDGSEAAAVSLLSGIPRDELDDLGGVPEPEVPARRRGKPDKTSPETRGYMGGVSPTT